MSNTNKPFGLRPVRHLNGTPWNGKLNEYFCTGAVGAVYPGDLVKLQGTTDANGVPQAIPGTAGATAIGVCVGVKPTAAYINQLYRTDSTDRTLLVCDDPTVIFEIQEDSDGGNVAAASVGLNANIVATAGSTTTEMSGHVLDSSSVNTTATLNLRILRLAKRPGNIIGNYAVWEVLLNNHSYRTTTGA